MYLYQFIYFNNIYNDSFTISFKADNDNKAFNYIKNNTDKFEHYFCLLDDCEIEKKINLQNLDKYNIDEFFNSLSGIYYSSSDCPYFCYFNKINLKNIE